MGRPSRIGDRALDPGEADAAGTGDLLGRGRGELTVDQRGAGGYTLHLVLVGRVGGPDGDPGGGEPGWSARGDAQLVLQGRHVALEVRGVVGGEHDLKLLSTKVGRLGVLLDAVALPDVAAEDRRRSTTGPGLHVVETGGRPARLHRLLVEDGRLGHRALTGQEHDGDGDGGADQDHAQQHRDDFHRSVSRPGAGRWVL